MTTLLWTLVRGAVPAAHAARARAGGPRALTVDGDFRHPSAAVLPERVGPLERDGIDVYDRAGCDVSATYRLGSLWATYYVYPAGAGGTQAEFERVMGEIAAFHHGASPVLKKEVRVAGRLPGLYAVYEYDESFFGFAVRMRSYAVLCRWGDWWLKWRVTAPDGGQEGSVEDVDELTDFIAEDLIDTVAPAEGVLPAEPPEACRPAEGAIAAA